MTGFIAFKTETPIDPTVLESFLKGNFVCQSFAWVEDLQEYWNGDGPFDPGMAIIHLRGEIKEGFRYWYEVLIAGGADKTSREEVTFFKQLAGLAHIRILASDDEADPRTWVLIEPDGSTSLVALQTTNDPMIIEEFYNHPFGDFRTEEPLTGEEQEILVQVIQPSFQDITIWHGSDGPVLGGTFNKVKGDFEKLRNFDHHYEIRPNGKYEWLDRAEKSELFVSLMKEFRDKVDRDLCLFPRIYVEKRELRGGYEYEEYCILLTKDGAEKMIYSANKVFHSRAWARIDGNQ